LCLAVLLAWGASGGTARAQAVDSQRIESAIQKASQWLQGQPTEYPGFRADELVLYALHHAGVEPGNPAFLSLLGKVEEPEVLDKVYCVSLQAMFFSEYDPSKYQFRIARCGQFLVDNQAANGQWGYGEPTSFPQTVMTGSAPRNIATSRSGKPARNRPSKAVLLRRRRKGPAEGDNSNAQYAALGLRACIEANVFPPRATLELAKKWWEETQVDDGGWPYRHRFDPTGSMSAGGLSSLVIYKHYLKEPWVSDPHVAKALEWMTSHFTVTENPKGPGWHLYYLYAVERVGILADRPAFGTRAWYAEGAEHLLSIQKPDGSWDSRVGELCPGAVVDTCYAILFLRKSTMPLVPVATEGGVEKPKK
jgi:hypothetical protein